MHAEILFYFTSRQIFRNKLRYAVRPKETEKSSQRHFLIYSFKRPRSQSSVKAILLLDWGLLRISLNWCVNQSKLLSLWINVSIIFSGQINGAEEWAVNGKKKKKDANSPASG